MPDDSDNVGVAFAMVIGAGAATGLGAAVVFFPALVKLASRKTLASALGLSAGVMVYVSFVEIIQKANDAFQDAGHNEDDSTLYMTLTFFGGVVFMVGLNYCVSLLLGGNHSHDHGTEKPHATREGDDNKSTTSENIAPCPCHDDKPIETLENLQNMGESMAKHPNHPGGYVEDPTKQGDDEETPEESRVEKKEDALEAEKEAGDKELMRMSLNTALAIGLHNFPEGLATFVATLDDPKVGGVLAVAIAIHNIPEGLCVAMPIYYATGDKWKAFWWALLSGASEPFAGLLGWIILSQSFSDTLYGVLFGMVGGMMVVISVRELLPTAHRYDPEDSVVTYSFIIGMLIMAVSLVLFLF